MKKINLEKLIYKLYIFFLPFQMFSFISFPSFLSRYLFINASTIFMWIGVFLLVVKKTSLPYNYGIRSFGSLYSFMTIYSLIAAVVLFIPLGTLNGEDTFRACIGDIIFFLIVLISIYYNWYCLSFIIDFRELKKVIFIESIIMVLIGYIQLGIIFGIGGLIKIYNIVGQIVQLVDTSKLSRGVVFGGTEPASAANLFLLIVPYHLSVLLKDDNVFKQKAVHLFMIIAYFPLVAVSDSSSTLIMMFITLITFLVIKISSGRRYTVLVAVALVIGMSVAVGYGIDGFSNNLIQFQEGTFQYKLIGKIIDTSSMSNAMRSSTIINDMKIFFSFPFTGIGNGLQGYMYADNLPNWVLQSGEVKKLLNGSAGVIDGGGAFFPMYLSGFGLIGIFVLIVFAKRYYWCYKNYGIENTEREYLFKSFLVLFLCAGWYSLGVEQNQYAAFLLSLPIIESYLENREEII